MARWAGYKAGYITHYASPKRLVAVLTAVELLVRSHYGIPRGATAYQTPGAFSKPPPSATRPPLPREQNVATHLGLRNPLPTPQHTSAESTGGKNGGGNSLARCRSPAYAYGAGGSSGDLGGSPRKPWVAGSIPAGPVFLKPCVNRADGPCSMG